MGDKDPSSIVYMESHCEVSYERYANKDRDGFKVRYRSDDPIETATIVGELYDKAIAIVLDLNTRLPLLLS